MQNTRFSYSTFVVFEDLHVDTFARLRFLGNNIVAMVLTINVVDGFQEYYSFHVNYSFDYFYFISYAWL